MELSKAGWHNTENDAVTNWRADIDQNSILEMLSFHKCSFTAFKNMWVKVWIRDCFQMRSDRKPRLPGETLQHLFCLGSIRFAISVFHTDDFSLKIIGLQAVWCCLWVLRVTIVSAGLAPEWSRVRNNDKMNPALFPWLFTYYLRSEGKEETKGHSNDFTSNFE